MQNYFNSTEAELTISHLKLSDSKDLQTEEIKRAQNSYCLTVGPYRRCPAWKTHEPKDQRNAPRLKETGSSSRRLVLCTRGLATCLPKSSHSKPHLSAFLPPEGRLELRQVTTAIAQ